MLRTPVYPVFAGGLDLLGGPWAIYLANVILQAGSSVLLYWSVARMFGRRAAWWSALAWGTDLMMTAYDFEAMSEPLSNFLVLLSFTFLIGMLMEVRLGVPTARNVAWAALALSLAILTRPSAMHLITLYSAVVMVTSYRRGGFQASLRVMAVFLGVCLAVLGPWVVRNAWVFSVPKLTSVDLNNLVYYAGAGAYEVEHKIPFEEAQARISRDFRIMPVAAVQNDFAYGVTPAEVDSELRRVWASVLFKYPSSLFRSSLTGLIRSFASHDVGLYARLLEWRWNPPGREGLVAMNVGAYRRLLSNGHLVSILIWQLVHTLLILVFSFIGFVVALNNPQLRYIVLVILLMTLYFIFTITLFGLEAYYRCRIPALPFLDMFAGLGAAWATSRIWR
jgi:4-amino-4-deoxy-L-arabinose transferase-like glycosyltransferase